MSEKRRRERLPTGHAARILSDQVNLDCTILDLSVTGARLEIGPGLFLPKLFVVRAPEIGGDRPVSVAWRNRTQVGVHFEARPRAR